MFTFLGTHVAPTLNLPSAQTVNELTALTFTVSAADTSIPAPTLTVSGSQLPTGASFSGVSGISPTGTFTWTPTETQAPGTFSVIFIVTDGVYSTQGSVTITVVEPSDSPTVTVPSAQTARVGTSLSFVVYARDPQVPTEHVNLTATGLGPNMAFDPASGTFSFTPSPSQLGQTYIVNFVATDPSNPSASSHQSVAIAVANTANQPPGGGFCVTCIFPKGYSMTMWLFIIGGLIGIVASIAILNIRARAELVGMRRRHRSALTLARHHAPQAHSEKIRTIMEHHHRTPTRNYEDN
jgi:hypothetical protein